MDKENIVIVIPTYNECENIPLLIPEIRKQLPEAHILVVDDNSPDGTAQIVKDLSLSIPNIHLLNRDKKEGLGKAYLAGFSWALKRNYDLIFEMDADFSHSPEYLPKFVETARNADLVIGSRYMNGTVNVVNWPLQRLLLSYFGNIAARLIAGVEIMDCTGGFKCFRADTLKKIDIDKIASSGYSFQVEMNFYVQKAGLQIKEIPIIFKDRELGDSKMSSKIVREAMGLLWKLRFMTLFSN